MLAMWNISTVGLLFVPLISVHRSMERQNFVLTIVAIIMALSWEC